MARWAAASAGDGVRARWAARRLFRAAERGDPAARDAVVAIGRTDGHRRRDEAWQAVVLWWARTHDPVTLRALALLGLLDQHFSPPYARLVPPLLEDPDPEVRGRANAFCRRAYGPVLDALWRAALAAPSPGTLRAVLLGNGHPPPPDCLNALWAEWIEEPAAELWEALATWRRPATSGPHEAASVVAVRTGPAVLLRPPHLTALIDAIALGDHPLGAIAREKFLGLRSRDAADALCEAAQRNPGLVRFCKQHALAPKDPVKRVVFFLLTGQPEQYHGMDPDGSLLSLAYAAASPDVRTRLQRAMLTAGELDLVRVIVGDDRRARIEDMSAEETRYLAGRLAEREEWAELWGIVQDLPVRTGAELIRLFDGWTPRGEDDRRVFEMFIETDPDEIAGALEYLRTEWPRAERRATFAFLRRVNDVSFAPDAPLLAVASGSRVAGVVDLTTGRLVERYDVFDASVGRVLHVGGGAVVAAERTNRSGRECRVLRCAGGDVQVLHTTRGSVTSLALTGLDGGFAAGTRAGRLLTGAAGGGPVGSRPVTALGLPAGDWPREIAAHRETGRLAVLGRSLVMTDPAAGWTAATGAERLIVRAEFAAADTLVCVGKTGRVETLRRDRDRLDRTALARVPDLGGLGSSPDLDGPVVADLRGDLYFFADTSLAAHQVHSADSHRDATGLHIAPGGDFLALGNIANGIDLFDLRAGTVATIAARPLVSLVPRHLGVVGIARRHAREATDRPRAARDLLDLLHACLEHRFRFDVEIGDAVELTTGEHDISL